MPIISSFDNVPIHYEIRGSGPVNVIFLHGWGGDCTTWAEILNRLDITRYRLFSVDLRAHGESGASATGYTVRHLSEDVLAVADHNGAKKFVIVGFSMGGKLGCYMAAKYSDRIPALILVASSAPGKVPVDRESALDGIRQANDWRHYEAVFKNWFSPSASDEVVKACCQKMVSTSVPTLEATAELFLWTSLADEIGRLEQPTLLVIGEHDPVYGMPYQEREMLPFLNHSTKATLYSGHFVPLEQPEKLTATISRFLSETMTKSFR